jgi:hypothetical protein
MKNNLFDNMFDFMFESPVDYDYSDHPGQYYWTNFCIEIECFKCGHKQKVELKTKPFKHACKECGAVHEIECFVKIKLVDGGKND